MAYWKREDIEQRLSDIFAAPVAVLAITSLNGMPESENAASLSSEAPAKIEFLVQGHGRHTALLRATSSGLDSDERLADRAAELIWEHHAFNLLPRHVRSLDICGIRLNGRLVSVADMKDFCLLTEYADGESYSRDLERIAETGRLTELDLNRADSLCDYLIGIHRVAGTDPELYVRYIRELVGGGECIMGLSDSYPEDPLVPPSYLERVEHLSVIWRWRVKRCVHRLRQVHGSFLPRNILFREDREFSVLNRSRSEYGDPAADVTSLSLTYLFRSLERREPPEGPFHQLFSRFWDRYLEKSGDWGMLEIAPLFIAFRALALANPLQRPSLDDGVRRQMLSFILNVLESDRFDPLQVDRYCGA